ncbi:MAG: GspE/PulE family protein [Candidatus Omnitrophica bacterium]|nr:GspE/PulE family protein [Candidatus Omnitrophota bacterium]
MAEKKHLGEMLVELGVISAQDLKVALEAQRQMPAPLGVTLVELGMAKEEQILPILCQQLNKIDVTFSLGKDTAPPSINSITDALQYLVERAIKEGATDLHLEPTASGVMVRIRIDGILHEIGAPPILATQYPAAVSRVKILCNLDIAEKRVPQDGRTTFKVGGVEYDTRISVLPSQYGESVAIRVLHTDVRLGLDKIGLDSKTYQTFLKILERHTGLVLVTGPTGSGKTTTLYACLDRLNDSTKKIVTVEDPIEYTLAGVIQMQVQPNIELSFGRLLRSVLRHDPNILMVGEIRDGETAEAAVRMALTGHLVFSTIHTNDAAATVTRLMDMGIEPYLVASSLSCVVAQRLVRTVCRECSGRRCMTCLGLGLKGRIGIFECLFIDEEMRKLITRRPTADELRKLAKEHGMRTLHEDGVAKVKAGITTQEELDRVIYSDDT